MNWLAAVEETVTGLGYELVDTERAARGLLRVYIDRVQGSTASTVDADNGGFVTVEDCEKVTRQLQHVLEVEGLAYERLEVSSPGLDRPLKKAADYARFAGEHVEVTLKLPFKGRKKYQGVLEARDDGGADAWRLVLDGPKRPGKGGGTRQKKSAVAAAKKVQDKGADKAAGAADGGVDQALDFSLEEVREARLVPVVDFKGRRLAQQPLSESAGDAPQAGQEMDGGQKK